MVKRNGAYGPLSEADIAAEKPNLAWAPPLWTPEPAAPPPAGTEPGEEEAMQLFQGAPFWCYLYSHEPQRAKKTPPKSAVQMADMYMWVRSGLLRCLPSQAVCSGRQAAPIPHLAVWVGLAA